jgi:tetratricopeptide (TPR) repeat protein/predicted Ser/Thr protein kinase
LDGRALAQRVTDALDAAGEATGAELIALIRARHASDSELIAEIEALMGVDRADASVGPRSIVVPVLDATMDANASATVVRSALQRFGLSGTVPGSGMPAPEPIPDQIGPYRVLRELGRGGMGVVYECEQSQPRRKVAVKVLRRGLGFGELNSTGLDSRREAQVLAKLTHPGIVRVIEAGVDAESGCTFFAMDLVEGQPLLQHARDAKLSTRERVELLARVCDAVEHAHRKGIIHRDIKPSNVLVELLVSRGEFASVGQPRVMDFGVAKFTDPTQGQSIMLPGQSSIVGTLGYISPEALRGEAHTVDTRADVYALGVVLFELLAGQPPISLAGVPLSEVARRVEQADVPLLRRFDPRLKGDLETIARKAMEKSAERRYGSAGELGDDLRRFLRNEPVVAQPASATYLVRKFVARNRGVSALAAGLVLALVAGLATTLVMINRVQQARTQEQAQRDTANAIRGYLVQDLIGAAQPGRVGKDAKITDVLGKLGREVGERFPDNPELEGRVRIELSTAFHGLGMYKEAIEQGEQAVQVLDATVGKDDPVTVPALAALAMAWQSSGDSTKAEPVAREGLDRARRVLSPEDPFILRLEAVLGGSLHAQRRVEESLAVLKPLVERLGDSTSLDIDDIASMRLQYATALQQAKPPQNEEAVKQLFALIAQFDQAKQPSHPAAVAARNNVIAILLSLDRVPEALEYATPLPDLAKQVFPPEHPAHGYIAGTMARVLERLGRRREGLDWWIESANALESALGDSTWQFERAVSGVAKAAHELRESSIARDWSVRTIAARLRTASRNEAATTVKVFEEYAPRLGESVPAALDLILRERDRLTPPEHPRRGRFLANLAWAALQMGRADEARALVEQATPADDDDREVIAAVREALEQQAGQKLDKGAGGEAPRSTGAK